MAYVITDSCLAMTEDSCRTDGAFPCVEACPVDGIHAFPGETQLFVDVDECIDCGACEPACPIAAVFVDYDLPDAFRALSAAKYAAV